jgi:hypothetical protein
VSKPEAVMATPLPADAIKTPTQALYEALEQSLTALEKAGKGFRQHDEEDDWRECPVCGAMIDHHGHSARCTLVAAENAARQAIVAWKRQGESTAPGALVKHAYAMTEPHLSGWRLIIGFEKLDDAQAAHAAIAGARL